MLGIKLESKKKMSCVSDIVSYDSPKYVYIPLNLGKYEYECNLCVNDKVKCGEKIGICNKNNMPLISTVSGKVVGYEEITLNDKEKSLCIKIENDFKDELGYTKCKNNIKTKEEFIELIRDKGIIGLSGSNYPTYMKYNTNSDIKTLIVNAVECEPYVTCDYMIIKEHLNSILKVLELMINIFNIEECFIAVKGKNNFLKEILSTSLHENKKIKFVTTPNLYPMGWSRNLVRYIKHTDYKKHTIEKNILINNVSTIYSIYEAVFKNKPLIERVVTFTGEGINNPCNVKVKFGTMFSDVVSHIGGYNNENQVLVSSGPMMGYNLPSDNIPINYQTNCFIAMRDYKESIETVCIRCGKCIENCPVKISPVLISENIGNKDELKKLNPNKCIECGICSYICPAKINLREKVKIARGEINGKC